jgi:hypothetical protein
MIRTAVELRLRGVGWKITEVAEAPFEYVYVNVNVLQLWSASDTPTGDYLVNTRLEVQQPSTLIRMHDGKTIQSWGRTWRKSNLGYNPKRSGVALQVREQLDILCDVLINDWYKVNPQ